MKVVVWFLALLSAAAGQQCISAQLNAATANFAGRIGLQNTTNIWKDYTVLNNYLLKLWSANPGSTVDILNICNGFDAFYGTLYPQQNYFCFSLQNLLQSGADETSAYSIPGTLEYYAFACGAGLTTLLHENLPCVQRVISGYLNTLQNCFVAFTNNVLHDAVNSCSYLTEFENCFAAPFNTSICRSAQTADVWWACEAARYFGYNRAVNCINSCDYRFGPPRAAEYLETHHKVLEDGTHMFKIPDYWDIVDGVVCFLRVFKCLQKQKVVGPWMKN